MDLITRISENCSESAHLKPQAMDALAGPIAAAAERMVQCPRNDVKIPSRGIVHPRLMCLSVGQNNFSSVSSTGKATRFSAILPG